MKGFRRGEKGFTLIELLIVVAILGVLAAVVIPNVVGLLGRGGHQAFETDEEVIQLAAATFYSDTHSGYDASTATWSDALVLSGHYYPTELGLVGNHTLYLDTSVVDSEGNPLIVDAFDDTPATVDDITNHAIWIGLLVNTPGNHGGADTDRDGVAPLALENGPYLNEIPRSAMPTDTYNGGPAPGGGYCWVVGQSGKVFGAYLSSDGNYYAGYSGAYP